MKRVLTALALIPAVAWVVLRADQWIFLAVLVTVAFLCYREYDDIAAGYGTTASRIANLLEREGVPRRPVGSHGPYRRVPGRGEPGGTAGGMR